MLTPSPPKLPQATRPCRFPGGNLDPAGGARPTMGQVTPGPPLKGSSSGLAWSSLPASTHVSPQWHQIKIRIKTLKRTLRKVVCGGKEAGILTLTLRKLRGKGLTRPFLHLLLDLFLWNKGEWGMECAGWWQAWQLHNRRLKRGPDSSDSRPPNRRCPGKLQELCGIDPQRGFRGGRPSANVKGSNGHRHGDGVRAEGLPAIKKLNLTEVGPDGAMSWQKWITPRLFCSSVMWTTPRLYFLTR